MTQFNTKLVHGPQLQTDKAGAIVPPVYQSAMYRFAPDGGTSDWDYARSSNPTRDYLERQIATLENGDAGFAFSSGVAAIATVLAIFPDGSHFIIGDSLYSGTDRLLNQYFAQHGLTFTPVDPRDLTQLKQPFGLRPKRFSSRRSLIHYSKSAASRLLALLPNPTTCSRLSITRSSPLIINGHLISAPTSSCIAPRNTSAATATSSLA